MFRPRLLLAILALLLGLAPVSGQNPVSAGTGDAPVPLRSALSRYLSLEMVRATFDVLPRDELEPSLENQAVRWKSAGISAAAIADIDRRLLAEGSYYLVSLSYLVQAGGAIFPADRPEAAYVRETVARLEQLQQALTDRIAAGEDVSTILAEAEHLRALTEGYTTPPAGFGPFADHDAMLEAVFGRIERGTRT